jgi:hypothetical protein
MTSQGPPAGYQIRVRGHLGATALRAFPALRAETRGHDTLLGGVADQAALHGVLAQIEALGLELLEVSLDSRALHPVPRVIVGRWPAGSRRRPRDRSGTPGSAAPLCSQNHA